MDNDEPDAAAPAPAALSADPWSITSSFAADAERSGMPAQIIGHIAQEFAETYRDPAVMREADERDRAEVRSRFNSSDIAAINRVLDSRGPGAKELFLSARLPNGRAIANDPATLASLIGKSDAAPARDTAAVDAEITGIEKTMRENRKSYDKDEGMQARYRALLTQRGV